MTVRAEVVVVDLRGHQGQVRLGQGRQDRLGLRDRLDRLGLRDRLDRLGHCEVVGSSRRGGMPHTGWGSLVVLPGGHQVGRRRRRPRRRDVGRRAVETWPVLVAQRR